MSKPYVIVLADGSETRTKKHAEINKLAEQGHAVKIAPNRFAMVGSVDLLWSIFQSGSGSLHTPECMCGIPGHQCGPTLSGGARYGTVAGQETMQLRKRKAGRRAA